MESPEKTLQQPILRKLYLLIALIVINSLLAGYIVFWRDSELKSYTFFTIFLDIWYWLLMLPGIAAALFSRFRWELTGLIVLLYIMNILIGYGPLII